MKATLELVATDLHYLFSDEVLEEVMSYFTRNYLLKRSVGGSLASEYYKRADQPAQYALEPIGKRLKDAETDIPKPFNFKIEGKKKKFNIDQYRATTSAKHKQKYVSAFRKALPLLWREIRETRFSSVGGVASMSIAPNLGATHIGQSMPRKNTSKSPYSSMFMATEFGTGVFASGKYKRIGGEFKVGNHGIWAQGANKERAPLFLGQKPFHLFFDRSGRKRKIYEQFIARKMPQALRKAYKKIRKRMMPIRVGASS